MIDASTTRLAGLAAAAAFAAFLTTAPASAQDSPATVFTATLSGGDAGDTDGSGLFTAEWDGEAGQLCYQLQVADIAPATAAHIHRGASGDSGPPVVSLEAPVEGAVESCVEVEAEVAMELADNPMGFYVNVHNEEFGGGAVRGQLETPANTR